MISILIPIYNYNIENLILKLEVQLSQIDITYEIICCDDCSTQHYNYNFEEKEYVSFLRNINNIGRTETRQKLARKAQFEWLLFLDADVIPKKESFLSTYIQNIKNTDFDVCIGGITYENVLSNEKYRLRWKYGLIKEDIEAKTRSKKPYKTIASANILIKKQVFLDINGQLKGNFYGYDNIFCNKLKEYNSKIHHINNEVYHLGLEDSISYLRKKELAAETIFRAYNANKINESDNKLLKTYLLLKRLNLTSIISFVFKKTKNKLRHNLLGSNPNMFLLNCYRLGYFCSLKHQSCDAD